jgi:hypothetical protein
MPLLRKYLLPLNGALAGLLALRVGARWWLRGSLAGKNSEGVMEVLAMGRFPTTPLFRFGNNNGGTTRNFLLRAPPALPAASGGPDQPDRSQVQLQRRMINRSVIDTF